MFAALEGRKITGRGAHSAGDALNVEEMASIKEAFRPQQTQRFMEFQLLPGHGHGMSGGEFVTFECG